MSREKQPAREVMSFPEVKAFLRIGTIKTKELLESGQIPGQKIGTRWRVYKDDAITYLRSGNQKCKGELKCQTKQFRGLKIYQKAIR